MPRTFLLCLGCLTALSCRPTPGPDAPQRSVAVLAVPTSATAGSPSLAEPVPDCGFSTLEATCDQWLKHIQPNHREACGLEDCRAQVLAASHGLRVHELGIEFTWERKWNEPLIAREGTLRGGSFRGYSDLDVEVTPECWGRGVHGS
jgi:hypothetical protein